jgi:Na+/melibiose symporter-like transporter
MTPKPQGWKIAQIAAGLAVAAGLIYFLFSRKSPPIVSWLIIVAVWVFVRQQRKAGLYDERPTFRRLAMASSNRPWRDFGLAVACFLATMAVTLGIVAGVDHEVLPDNKVTYGILILAIIAGIAGVLFFMSGMIARVIYGPPPP